MRRFTWGMLGLISIATLVVAQFGRGVRPDWAFPNPDKDQPKVEESSGARKIPGSQQSYTAAQIDNLANPPDWFPSEHGTLPNIVQHGAPPNALACSACHLMSGHGHPESADIAGMPVGYLLQTMNDFKSGARKDTARMNAIAKAISDEDIKQASEWAASLKPTKWVKVVEADTVPKSYVSTKGRMRLPYPGGGMEPLGNRIVELPDDPFLATSRDPKSGFTAYVPRNAISRGEMLANSGVAKTVTCAVCHGEGLKGLGDVPRIAGLHPIYIVRQLSNFQTGVSAGTSAALMKRVVANLTEDDLMALAAYTSSLEP